MKQRIEASITGAGVSVDVAASVLKSTAVDLGFTPDWATLEVDGIENYGTYSDRRLMVTVRATCHGEVEVPE